jgi:hypothetical protein
MREVSLSCAKGGDAQAVAHARLGNLGYSTQGAALQTAVLAFQLDHDLTPVGLDDGGEVPLETIEAIAQEWARLHG